jgi:hypothetical protein
LSLISLFVVPEAFGVFPSDSGLVLKTLIFILSQPWAPILATIFFSLFILLLNRSQNWQKKFGF